MKISPSLGLPGYTLTEKELVLGVKTVLVALV